MNIVSQERPQGRKNKAPSHRKPKRERNCVLMLSVRHKVSKAGNKEPGQVSSTDQHGKLEGQENKRTVKINLELKSSDITFLYLDF